MKTQIIQRTRRALALVAVLILSSNDANAAGDFVGTLQKLVDLFLGRILPVAALGFVGKNIFGHITGNPNSKQETVQVVIATVALLGIRGVWSLFQQVTN